MLKLENTGITVPFFNLRDGQDGILQVSLCTKRTERLFWGEKDYQAKMSNLSLAERNPSRSPDKNISTRHIL